MTKPDTTIPLSTNEFRALVIHASRGVNYPMPEALAYSAVSLAKRGFAAGARVCQLLSQHKRHAISWGRAPNLIGQRVTGWFCPILVGCYWLDSGYTLPTELQRIENIAVKDLLLPYLAELAKKVQLPIKVDTFEYQWMSDGTHWLIKKNDSNHRELHNSHAIAIASLDKTSFEAKLDDAQSDGEKLTGDSATDIQRCRVQCRVHLTEEIYQQLKNYAHLHYAPATEASRLKGAG